MFIIRASDTGKYRKKMIKKHSQFALVLALLTCPMIAFAAGGKSDPIAPVIFGVTAILFCAILGRFAARKLNVPIVLGELCMGILAGNLCYWFGSDLILVLREGTAIFDIMAKVVAGASIHDASFQIFGDSAVGQQFISALTGKHSADLLSVAHVVDAFSRYGVIFLLFLVGLESSVEELNSAGWSSIRVAIIGILAPIALGFTMTYYLMPSLSTNASIFIAATLTATSVGITARVLRDLNMLKTSEAKIILGAALLDDVLGLILLAIVAGIVVAGSLAIGHVMKVIVLATIFLAAAIFIGPYFLKLIIRLVRQLTVLEAKLFISFLFVMLMSWLANLAGLATIIGAFAAGLILHDGYFHHWGDVNKHEFTIKDLVSPIEAILAPIFFVLIGIQVKIESFLSWQIIGFASALIVVAIIGKVICGWGARKLHNRWAIGIGMMPRGEVGIVFAGLGKSIGVINDQIFSSVILMVIVTTLVAPPLLKWQLKR